ncbi:hypothetical protein [Bacillus benzoevorans]|uniref:Uncharacterized protein n=1 Tax=Bacillus benzoevorans TaxID=1456 RepID=A0A7X0HPC0_9BACI|nr:hypothetical protein [Bacillus benzoevorans]MBB6444363.1 hypothetical protein [Bacillus benzoevorans]
MTKRVKGTSTTEQANAISSAEWNNEYQNKLEKRSKEVRNHVVEAQKQMSLQATAGVFDENQS